MTYVLRTRFNGKIILSSLNTAYINAIWSFLASKSYNPYTGEHEI